MTSYDKRSRPGLVTVELGADGRRRVEQIRRWLYDSGKHGDAVTTSDAVRWAVQFAAETVAQVDISHGEVAPGTASGGDADAI